MSPIFWILHHTARSFTHDNTVPLGDSITEITCWRAYVWDDLAAANLSSQVQYVGSQNSNPQNCKPKTANVGLSLLNVDEVCLIMWLTLATIVGPAQRGSLGLAGN